MVVQITGVYANRGTVYATLGEYRRAIEDYDEGGCQTSG